MTMLLLDVASYQGSLSPADVKRAGFDAVNLKISHGLGFKAVHPEIGWWISQCAAVGLKICTFHYLTADYSGAAQADFAYGRLQDLGLIHGTAHQVDVEASIVPDLAEVRSYVEHMTEMLQRPVALYTGDWWWTARPTSWRVDDLAPHLWAAPNAGYPGSYPGDDSPHWRAGYGGWANLSIMQYAVAPLSFPDGTRGTIDVSKSAIRDATVWRDLTEGRPSMTYAPKTLLDARQLYIDCLGKAGFKIAASAVGIVADAPHNNTATSYHCGKSVLKPTAYSIVESSRDKNGLTDAASALDLGWFEITVKGAKHNLRTFSAWLVRQCEAKASDTLDIREVIYSLDGKTVKRWDRLGKRTTGDISHTGHTHLSRFRDAEGKDSFSRLIRRYFTEIGVLEAPGVSKQEVLDGLNEFFAGAKANSDGMWETPIGQWTFNQPLPNPFQGGKRTQAWVLIRDMATAIATGRDDVDETAIIAGVLQGIAAAADGSADAVAEKILAGLPADLAEQVVRAMGQQLAAARAARPQSLAEYTGVHEMTGDDDTGGAPEQNR